MLSIIIRLQIIRSLLTFWEDLILGIRPKCTKITTSNPHKNLSSQGTVNILIYKSNYFVASAFKKINIFSQTYVLSQTFFTWLDFGAMIGADRRCMKLKFSTKLPREKPAKDLRCL